MAEIGLLGGGATTVDDANFDWLSQWRWRLNNRGYVIRHDRVLMHRVIAAAEKGQEVDHINRVKLDNRRSNLRFCTHQENARNRGHTRRVPGLRGTHRDGPYWRAMIMINGRQTPLGTYDTELAAALAYDAAAREHFGEFALPNFDSDRDWLFVGNLAPRQRGKTLPGRSEAAALTAPSPTEREPVGERA